MVACQLLLEITSFLRETYQNLPKPRKVDRGGFGRAPTRDSEYLELPSSSAPSMTTVQRQASAGSSVTSSPPPPRHSAPHTVVDSPSGRFQLEDHVPRKSLLGSFGSEECCQPLVLLGTTSTQKRFSHGATALIT